MPSLSTLAFGAIISSTVATLPPQAASMLSTNNNGCVRTGCNGEVCLEVGAKAEPTICKVTAASACYQYGNCARNAQGQCGWQSTPTFDNCIKVANGGSLDAPSDTTPAVPTLDYNKIGPTGN